MSEQKHTPTQFGTLYSADFSENHMTLEMRPGFRVAAGPVAVLDCGVYAGLLEALTQLVEEKVDYMRLNHLGNPEETHTIKVARAALSKATGQSPIAGD